MDIKGRLFNKKEQKLLESPIEEKIHTLSESSHQALFFSVIHTENADEENGLLKEMLKGWIFGFLNKKDSINVNLLQEAIVYANNQLAEACARFVEEIFVDALLVVFTNDRIYAISTGSLELYSNQESDQSLFTKTGQTHNPDSAFFLGAKGLVRMQVVEKTIDHLDHFVIKSTRLKLPQELLDTTLQNISINQIKPILKDKEPLALFSLTPESCEKDLTTTNQSQLKPANSKTFHEKEENKKELISPLNPEFNPSEDTLETTGKKSTFLTGAIGVAACAVAITVGFKVFNKENEENRPQSVFVGNLTENSLEQNSPELNTQTVDHSQVKQVENTSNLTLKENEPLQEPRPNLSVYIEELNQLQKENASLKQENKKIEELFEQKIKTLESAFLKKERSIQKEAFSKASSQASIELEGLQQEHQTLVKQFQRLEQEYENQREKTSYQASTIDTLEDALDGRIEKDYATFFSERLSAIKEEKKQEIAHLYAELEAFKQENRELESKLLNHSKETTQLKTELFTKSSQIEALRESQKEQLLKISALKEEIPSAEFFKEHNALKQDIEVFQNTLQEKQEAIASLEYEVERKNDLIDQFKGSKAKYEVLQGHYDELYAQEKELTEKCENLFKALEKSQLENNQLTKSGQELSKKVNQLEETLQDYQQTKETLYLVKEALKQEKKQSLELNNQVIGLKGMLAKANQIAPNYKAIQQENQSLRQEVTSLESSYQKVTDKQKELLFSFEKLKNIEEELALQKEEKRRVEEELILVKAQASDVLEAQGKINHLEEKIKEYEIRLNADQQKEIENPLREKVSEKEKENESLKEELNRLLTFEKKYQKEKVEKEEKQALLGQLVKNMQELKGVLSEIEHSRVELLEELGETKKSQKELIEKIARLKQEKIDQERSYTTNKEIAERQKDISASTRIHLVSKGETLSGISKRYYGKASRWREIYEANKGVVQEGNRLKIGSALVIP